MLEALTKRREAPSTLTGEDGSIVAAKSARPRNKASIPGTVAMALMKPSANGCSICAIMVVASSAASIGSAVFKPP